MELWISGGGTAGHVFPALTVLDALGGRISAVRWLGRAGGIEEALVAARGIPFEPVATGPIVGAGAFGVLASAWRMAVGTTTAWRAMRAHRPDVVLVTGGFVSVPAALAARLAHVPLAVFLPDVRPGRAVATIARLADRILVTHADALDHLPRGRATVTGYPVRPAVRSAQREDARARLGLAPDEPLLLVFGGSQGARRLNEAIAEAAPRLVARCRVLHASGPRGIQEARARHATLPAAARARYRIEPFLDEAAMADALAAADLAVCRAGASTLGELPARALPAILVPLPIAGGHQWPNARVLEQAGAAIAVPDEALDGERLATEALALLDAPERLAAMRRASAALDAPRAADDIGAALAMLAGRAA